MMVDRDSPHSPADVTFREPTQADAPAMRGVEQDARRLFDEVGVPMLDLDLPESFNRPISWDLALVAEADGRIIGSARLRALDDDVLCLDQVSVASAWVRSGIARELLARLADAARARGFRAVTGTTFRDIAFNRRFYEQIGAVVDVDPHPAMVHHRAVEEQVGLDRLGERVVMRLDLVPRADDGARRGARG